MLKLRRSQVEEIIEHVQTETPLEAGGLLAGHGTSVERVYAMKNADQSEITYRLDPEEQRTDRYLPLASGEPGVSLIARCGHVLLSRSHLSHRVADRRRVA